MATLLILLLFLLMRPSRSFNHWVVTEEGKIEYQVRASTHSYNILAYCIYSYVCVVLFEGVALVILYNVVVGFN